MRLATWNVNGLRARLDFVLEWLAERKPDAVGLQELKLEDSLFPHERLREAGYHALCHGQKSWNGVAILSREPAVLQQAGLPGQEDFGARRISADLGGIRFTTVYCPNGKDVDHDDYARKLRWFDALAEELERESAADAPALLCGDFNICPAPLDSHHDADDRTSIFHTDAERARMQRFYAAQWIDVYRRLHPDERAYTWWDYRAGAFHRGHGLRIDFLLASPALAARLRAVGIDREWRRKRGELTPSDHVPVWADFD